MAFTQLLEDLNIVQGLSDRPNATEGLTAAQLKEKFDAAANFIKAYINDTLLVELAKTTDGSSGADNIGITAITSLTGTTLQAILESLRNNLKSTTDSSSGADFIGATAITGVTGATVQAILEGLKAYVDAQGTSIGNNYVSKTELTDTRKLDASANFTGSWFGISNPAYADPGIAGVVADHTAQLADISYNVKSYGAKGDWDGSTGTDDTIFFENTISAFSSAGGVVQVPKGDYLIDSFDVNVPIIFRGVGSEASRIFVKNTLNNIGITVKSSFVNFENIQIISTGTEDDGNNVTGVLFDNGEGSIGYNTISDFTVKNFSGRGIKFINPIHVSIRDGYMSNNIKAIEFGADYGSYGTTVTIDSLYIAGGVWGIYAVALWQSEINRVIVEASTNGHYFESAGGITLISEYYEALTGYDVVSVDCLFNRVSPSRLQQGDSVSWSNKAFTDRANAIFSDKTISGKIFTHYAQSGTSEKTIRPYNFLSEDVQNCVDGILYDNQRAIPIISGKNIFKLDGWSYDFDPNRKSILFSHTGGGTAFKYCSQTVALTSGKTYLILASYKNISDNIENVEVLDPSSSQVALFRPDTGSSFAASAERFVYLEFTAETTGDFTVRFTAYYSGTDIEVDIYGPTLIDMTGDIEDRSTWGASSYDEAMQNSYILSGHLSGLRDGYDYFGKGNKVIYGTAAPTTGTWKVGDECRNTVPAAAGYMGWVCVTTGTPGTWKGYGLIQS